MRIFRVITGVVMLAGPAATAQAQTPAPVAGPSLAQAQAGLAAAQAKAAQLGVAVSCAVLDARGSIVAVIRMDKAVYYTANLAIAKARASAIFGAPSGALDAIGALHLDEYIELGKMMFHQGAVPITLGGQRAGAIGCGGSTPQQDEESAKAGQATFR